MKIVTIEQMRELDRQANAAGQPFAALMERAGRAVAEAIGARCALAGASVLVLVGPGHNGGDGLVCGRYLAQMGAQVGLYIWKREVAQDANWARAAELGLAATWSGEDAGLARLRQLAAGTDVIVDALLGTGVARPIGGTLLEILEATRQALAERRVSDADRPLCVPHRPPEPSPRSPLVVAVDVPSGIDGNTGAADPAALPADLTVTFGLPKIGQFRYPAAALLGELLIADIGIPAGLDRDIRLELATPQGVRQRLPLRPPDAHKGSFGKALVVAGSARYVGAACLASAAASRAGAGLVTLAAAQTLHPILAAKLTEATFLPLPDAEGALVEAALAALDSELPGYQALLVGPGLGQDPRTRAFIRGLLGLTPARPQERLGFLGAADGAPAPARALPPALVIDADGLNGLAETPGWWRELRAPAVLTPHPGEMARLLGCSVAEVQADRLGAAQRAARDWGHVVA
ncbi:MAG: bifunctional ADP-dependent NAD(P)H-hydrate dehydratase/NAD(P)H-hydrate epimerase, partial [Chloroflexi bacterium]|nr:bifunctional ADP-dependent NAD(P)H-hydrate dehydratase/NAD(P)H-hydrate epimerase [Chloroflexota bacterium]